MIANRARLRSARNQRFQRQQPTVEERMAAGVALRQRVPRSSHADWSPSAQRPDPINVLQHCDCGRLQELLPIRLRRIPFPRRGKGLIEIVDVKYQPTLGARKPTEIRSMAITACLEPNSGCWRSGKVVGHHGRGAPVVKRLAASIVLGLREPGRGSLQRCRL